MSRRSRGLRRFFRHLWEDCAYYAGLPGKFLSELGQNLARGWRRNFGAGWQSLIGVVAWPFQFLFRLARRSLRLFSGWWTSRSVKHLLQGLPALAAGVGVLVLAVLLRHSSDEALGFYLRHGAAALNKKDYETALVCYERLAQIDPEKPEYRLALAVTSFNLKQPERGTALLEKLASPDRQGYTPAHLLQAKSLLAVPNVRPDALQLAERHLARVIQAEPERLEAHLLLAQVYQQTNRLERAEPHLLKAAQIQPDTRLALARLYRIQGRMAESKKQAELAAQHFQGQVKADLDNHLARSHLADALFLQGKFPEAAKVLEEGLSLSGNVHYRRALANLMMAWCDSLEGEGIAVTANRLSLVEKAMQYDRDNPAIAQRLLGLLKSKDPAEAEKARVMLQTLLAQGETPATIHVLLGLNAWQNGKKEEAKQHLEQAHQLSPQALIIANNLAWTLAHQDQPELPRALEMIQAVLEKAPGQPRFRDTRGVILAKMGRWKEALPDLEAALSTVSDKKSAHLLLAKAYAEVGDAEMSALHQQMAEKGEDQSRRNPRPVNKPEPRVDP